MLVFKIQVGSYARKIFRSPKSQLNRIPLITNFIIKAFNNINLEIPDQNISSISQIENFLNYLTIWKLVRLLYIKSGFDKPNSEYQLLKYIRIAL